LKRATYGCMTGKMLNLFNAGGSPRNDGVDGEWFGCWSPRFLLSRHFRGKLVFQVR
jgi:hypothetical protein